MSTWCKDLSSKALVFFGGLVTHMVWIWKPCCYSMLFGYRQCGSGETWSLDAPQARERVSPLYRCENALYGPRLLTQMTLYANFKWACERLVLRLGFLWSPSSVFSIHDNSKKLWPTQWTRLYFKFPDEYFIKYSYELFSWDLSKSQWRLEVVNAEHGAMHIRYGKMMIELCTIWNNVYIYNIQGRIGMDWM